MMRPVLLGGRQGLGIQSQSLWLLAVWLPAVVCLFVISRESTDAFSSAHTSGWLRHLAEWFTGPITQPDWEKAHHLIRKTGHFLGYGMVGLCWLRAWLLMWLKPFRLAAARLWRGYAVAMALCCTMATAACDEVHQAYLPSRTGVASDVWLDTAGAAVLMLLVSSFWLSRRKSRASLRVQA